MATREQQLPTSVNTDFVPAVPYAQNRFREPPRLTIPPPTLDYASGQPVLGNLTSQQASSHDYGSSEYGNPIFLAYLRSSCNMIFNHQMLSWEYNMRRTAQPILPFLLLGPSTVARDINYVRDNGITMMISVRSAVAARAAPKYMNPSTFVSAAGLSTITLDLDTPYDLITRLPQTIKAMNDHLEGSVSKGMPGEVENIKGKILVFCESGNERSTALVAAYLMVLFGVDVVSAMQIVQSQRFCIAPEDGMKNMLITFEDVLKAKREVRMQTFGITKEIEKKSKRNVDMMYDDDDEMIDGEAVNAINEDAGARKDWAPFQSRAVAWRYQLAKCFEHHSILLTWRAFLMMDMIMAPRHNPRRNVGAPLRLEDDDTYLLEPPRDTTKPAWPKLLAQSTVPYDHALPSVKWNTRPLDQTCSQTQQQAPNTTQEVPAHKTTKDEDFSKQLTFDANCDLDMSTSESEGESDREDHERSGRDVIVVAVAPKWSSLEPALQLSIYEYVYYFLDGHKQSELVEVQNEVRIRAKAAEVLGLSNQELSEIESQRAFRKANPVNEDYLQKQWWEHEERMMIEEDLLAKDICQYRSQWQAINSRYTALMVQICKYKYANERAIDLAKAYVKARGLKPEVVGKWSEGEEETTMVFVSSEAVDPKSPILLPVPLCPTVPEVVVSAVNAASRPLQSSTINEMQMQPAPRFPLSSLEIRNVDDFAKRHDPKLARPKSAQEYQRGRSPIHPSEIHLTVNSNGNAEIRKKHSKRRAESELRRSRSDEYVGGQRIVVRADGTVGIDVNTKVTTEVEGLLRTGIEASRHGKATGLTNRMQKSLEVPTSAQEFRPRRFSNKLLGIDSDYMATATGGDFASNGQRRQPLLLTSTPPQPEWSPIASPSTSPSPTKSTPGVPQTTTADLKCPAPALTPQSTIKPEPESHQPQFDDEKRAPVQFNLHTIFQDITSSTENQSSHQKGSGPQNRSSSVPPLPPPDTINDDHDSGIGTSRATSTEQDVLDRGKKVPSKIPRPKPKLPEQPVSDKATPSNRKLGKGARGGPGAYKKKQETAKDPPLVTASPLAEKTNMSTSGGTSHAV